MKSRLLYWICAVFITSLVTSPILWSVRTSLAPARDSTVLPSPTFEHYRFLLSQELLYVYVKNSVIVSLATVIVVLVPAILSGYALARLNFPGKRLGILFLLVPLIPPIAVLVPLISYMYQFQLVNTLFGLIVLNAAFNLPFAVWMTRGFMLGVPVEVEEAAMIDGLSRFGAMLRITVPLTVIGLFAVGAFVFIQTWNNYIYAYAIISSPDQRVLPMGILASLGAWGTQWGSLTAFGTLGVLPPIILLLIFQRWFIAGMLGRPE